MSDTEHGFVDHDQARKARTPDVQQQIAQRLSGGSGMANYILHLQRTAGNQAVNQVLRKYAARQAATRLGTSLVSAPSVQRCGTTPCGCSTEDRAEAGHVSALQTSAREGASPAVVGTDEQDSAGRQIQRVPDPAANREQAIAEAEAVALAPTDKEDEPAAKSAPFHTGEKIIADDPRMCGGRQCYSDDAIKGQIDESNKDWDQFLSGEAKFRNKPFQERLSEARLEARSGDYYKDFRVLTGEEVWKAGQFTEMEKSAVFARQKALNEEVAEEWKRVRDHAGVDFERNLEAQGDQWSDPKSILQVPAFAAVGGPLAVAYEGAQIGMMLSDAEKACAPGISGDCALAMAPLLVTGVLHSLAKGEPGASPTPVAGIGEEETATVSNASGSAIGPETGGATIQEDVKGRWFHKPTVTGDPGLPAGRGSPIGLETGGSAPQEDVRGRLFHQPTVTGDPRRAVGTGTTNKFGDITYSTQGSLTEQALVRYHEQVHSFLSPKFIPLRTFRADLMESGYQKSKFLKYVEEALAETYAQLRVNGIKGLPSGIRFPITNGYVTLKDVVTEAAIGTVVAGGITYGVYIAATSHSSDPAADSSK